MCTLDDVGDAASSNILQDRLDLIVGGRILSHIELKLLTCGLCLARLVEGGSSSGIGRDLLEKVGDSHGGRRASLVEDRDDVERLVLRE